MGSSPLSTTSRGSSLNTRLLRAGSAVASAALLTAVVGFAKEISVARLFGAGITYDAYLVAFAAVTLLPTVTAFVLQSTFVPSFLESRQRNSSEAWAFAGTIVTIVSVALLAGMLLVVLSERAWFSLLIPGFGASARQEVSRVVLLLLPLVWLVGINELLKALLNALKSFALPAASQVAPSLFALAGILLLGGRLGIVALAIGWVFGMIAQTAVLLWQCRLLHVRLPLGLRSSRDLSNLAGLSAPYVAVALMPWALLLIDQHFASQIGTGAISVLNYADRIFRVPLTVLIAALYTSVHPFFAEAAAQRRYDDFGALFRRMIRAGVFVLLPIGLAIVVLRQPIVAFVYQRGAFDAHAVHTTASVLAYLGLLVPALGVWYLCDRALTCLHRTRQLMVLAGFATGLKFGSSLLLVPLLGLPGLPLSTLITFGASVAIMMGFLRSDLGDRIRVSTWAMSRIALAALVSGAGLFLTWSGLSALRLGPEAIQVAVALLVGMGLYLLATRAMRLEESAAVTSAIRTLVAVPLRRGRRTGPPSGELARMRILQGPDTKLTRWIHQEKFILAHPMNLGRPVRATLRFLAWAAWTRLIRRPRAIRFWDDLRLLAHADDRIAKLAVYTGLPDYHDMLFTLRYLRPSDTFVDVGANVGIYSLLAARAAPQGQVLAFEPNPVTAERMRANLRLNRLDNVIVWATAVGSATGSATLTSALGPGDHIALGRSADVDTVTVRMTTLDEAVKGTAQVSLVKIDVEGFEVEVLKGATALLGRDHSPVWIMELNGLSQRYGAGDAAIEEEFRKCGYSMYLYDADANRLMEAATPSFREAYDDRARWIAEVGINVLFIRDVGTAVERLAGAAVTASDRLQTSVDVEARRGR